MKVVDLTHPWSIHTPGWTGYPGPKMYYTQNFHTQRIVSQAIETALHVGTHIDAEMHGADGGADIASVRLDRLIHRGVVADIRDDVEDWSIITPEMITSKVEVQKGDILIIFTGYKDYYAGGPKQDISRYMNMHPGPGMELCDWMAEMELAWFGVDCGSGDHPMWTSIRYMRADLCRQFEAKVGKSVEEFFPPFTYRHASGRVVEETLWPAHYKLFPKGIIHAENVGGDLEKVANQRCVIGAFPWKLVGGEASICRILAFLDTDLDVVVG
jgi:kynurenine formamidase